MTQKMVDGMLIDLTSEEAAEINAQIAAMAAPTTPRSVTRRQAWLALLNANLLDAVEAAIAAGSRAAQVEWLTASTFDRDHGLVLEMSAALGWSDEQLDALFIEAGKIPCRA